MKRSLFSALFVAVVFFSTLQADIGYIVGDNSDNQSIYWSLVPPTSPPAPDVLDKGDFDSSYARAVAIAADRTTIFVGKLDDGDDNTLAVYWKLTPTGEASDYVPLEEQSEDYESEAIEIGFNKDGVAYIVGRDNDDNGCFWTVTPAGDIDGPIELDSALYATAVAFTSENKGYISGTDQMSNVCYWVVDEGNVVTGPFYLVGGETGGAAYPYAIAVTPSDVTYIVGANNEGKACYWTISALGVASSDNLLIDQINSMATDVAFLPTGEGIIVGQGPGNVSCYWTVAANGATGVLTALANGSGNGSSAYGVAYDSTGTAYIVGLDSSNQAAYWTLPLNNPPAVYHLLESGSGAICNDIAIYPAPNPPENLSGRFVKNSFGWVYENALVLVWRASNSASTVGYNIYKNGIKIDSVSSNTLQYANHNQDKHQRAIYAVTAVDEVGNESVPTIITIN